MKKVTVLGAGLMGAAIALTLHNKGCKVNVYNRTPEKLAPLATSGVQTFTDPNAAVAGVDCVISMLSDYQAAADVLCRQLSEQALKSKTLLQMATISPSQSQALAESLGPIGVNYIECPVLGSTPEAASGSLILMVGCDAEQFLVWQDFLKLLGPNPVHIGDIGSAAAVKLAMNHLIGALTAAFSTSLAYVQQNRVDIDKFMSVVRDSALYAKTYDKKLERMLDRNFANPNFPTKHLLKDMNLFLESLSEYDLNDASARGVQQVVEKAVEQGFPDTDYSVLYEAILNK